MRDPYQVLGLSKSATEAEIKKAFRRLAKEYHPDRNKDDARAKDKFAEVNSAYEIVGDKEKRAKFDRGEIDAEGKPRFQGFEGFGPGGGFAHDGFGFGGGARRSARGFRQSSEDMSDVGMDDILSQILGGFARDTSGARAGFGQKATAKEGMTRGEDVHVTTSVTLEDVVAGNKAKVTLPNGKTLNVTLPKGVENGQQIRLKGQGSPAQFGGIFGDALVTVTFAPHKLFRLDGHDLRLDLPVGLDEVVLGAKVRVPTLEGAVDLSLPAGSTGARTMRLRGKGMPKADGSRGDLFVQPRIVLPEDMDTDLETLMKRWREEGRTSPRGAESDAA